MTIASIFYLRLLIEDKLIHDFSDRYHHPNPLDLFHQGSAVHIFQFALLWF